MTLLYYHSGLSNGERYDEWQKIRDGRAREVLVQGQVCSAPFKNLGLIIIDEEHESTYKQEDYPRYHARELPNGEVNIITAQSF